MLQDASLGGGTRIARQDIVNPSIPSLSPGESTVNQMWSTSVSLVRSISVTTRAARAKPRISSQLVH